MIELNISYTINLISFKSLFLALPLSFHVKFWTSILKVTPYTHDITISTLLSTHAPLIYKQDPTPNPSFPIYQLIQHITKKINNCQLVQKIRLFTNWVLQKSLKPNASGVKLFNNKHIFLICLHMRGLKCEFTSITPQ
jgi:hypothetical protein